MSKKYRLLISGLALCACYLTDVRVADAVLVVNVSSYTPPGLPGFTGFTFEVVPADLAVPILGVEGHFNSPMGMNHVNLGSHIDNSNNGSLTSDQVLQDSQFDIDLSPAAGGGVIHFLNETNMLLEGGTSELATPVPPGPFPVAHVVIPSNAVGGYAIAITYEDSDGFLQEEVGTGMFSAIPEASQVMIGFFATIAISIIYLTRRLFVRKATCLAPTDGTSFSA
jgi:hypothetical protein